MFETVCCTCIASFGTLHVDTDSSLYCTFSNHTVGTYGRCRYINMSKKRACGMRVVFFLTALLQQQEILLWREKYRKTESSISKVSSMKLSVRSFVFVAIVASCICSTLAYAPVRTKVTQEWYQQYRSKLPSDYNVVANGGWYAVEKRATKELASRNFQLIRSSLASDKLSLVAAGGWDTLEQLSADPKGELVKLVTAGLTQPKKKKSTDFTKSTDAARIVALCNLLQGYGKGFEADLVKGEWCSVLNLQGSKSPSFQKAVGKGEKGGLSYSNFDIDNLTFNGNVKLIFGQGDLQSTVAYKPVSDNYDMINGKLVLRRISADIVDASWKFWKLPRVKLPLRAKDGYLDFLYMDEDMRITRGNRGGLFIHFRPDFLERVLKKD